MPNWCSNNIQIHGPKTQLKKLLKDMEAVPPDADADEVEVRLVNLLPMPDSLRGTRSPSPSGAFDPDGELLKLVIDDDNEYWTTETYAERKAEHDTLVAKSLKAKAETGYDNWYDWANEIWGTKWGDCQTHIDLNEKDSYNDVAYVSGWYETAWGPFEADFWIKVSQEYPKLKFAIGYVEEGMNFRGADTYQDGECLFSQEDEVDRLWQLAVEEAKA